MNKQNINNEFIQRIESELLSTLFNYVVPFIDKKIKTSKENLPENFLLTNVSNLENIINNQKPKINFEDIKELESLLLKNLNKNIEVNKNIRTNSNIVFYSLNLRQQKNSQMRVSFELSERELASSSLSHSDACENARTLAFNSRTRSQLTEKSNNYSISIKYEENESNEKLRISIKKGTTELYSSEIKNQKESKDNIAPYSIKITYEDNYAEERLTITYQQQLKNYIKKHVEDREDMTNRVPLKWLNILPETIMGGILGFTYLGENFMARRADLVGKTARMVDIHESIHTPDEYETRCLT